MNFQCTLKSKNVVTPAIDNKSTGKISLTRCLLHTVFSQSREYHFDSAVVFSKLADVNI